MKKLLYTLVLIIPVLVLGQSTNQNYVKTTTYKKPVIDPDSVLESDKIEQVTYYDGLGRPIQSNAYKAGGAENNIITHIEYDGLGRKTKNYLPAPAVTTSQDYISNAEDVQRTYYQTVYGNELNLFSPNPYSEVQYEGSSLNRVLQQAAPGEDWSLYSGHTVKFDYQTNSGNEIKNFGVNFPDPTNTEVPELVLDGNYNVNELYKTITKDENWVIADGFNRTTEEFKDKLGRVILKRTYNNGIKHDTQYVYDKFGNLTYVLSPKGSDTVVTLNQFTDFNNDINVYKFIHPGRYKQGTATGVANISLTGTTLKLDLNVQFTSPRPLTTGAIYQLPIGIPNVNFNTGASLSGYEMKVTNGYLTIFHPQSLYSSTLPSVSGISGTFTVELPEYEIHQDVIDDLCYQYRYDYRNRLIEKKIPQKGWEYIVYDKLDRPRLTQDANLAVTNEWLYTKYDVFGRVTYTGKTSYVSPLGATGTVLRRVLQSNMNAHAVLNESRIGTSTLGSDILFEYTNQSYPIATDYLTANYYDTYTKESGIAFGNKVPSASGYNLITGDAQYVTTDNKHIKSLSTVSKIRVLNTDDWILSATYYDKKSRPLFIASKNDYLETKDYVTNEIDFIGNITASQNEHEKVGQPTIVTTDGYTYDHQNRLIKQIQDINGGGWEVIVSNTYDELGQLIKKDVGNTQLSPLQSVDYTYNIRGWLKQINDVTNLNNDLFSFKLNYNTIEGDWNGTTTSNLYNGNISQVIWNTANDAEQKSYAYTYDALNRINEAHTRKGNLLSDDMKFDLSGVNYDKNGNILNLNRNNITEAIDELDYSYDGNQLTKVKDNVSHIEGFKDGVDILEEYIYDANGNMIFDANKKITSILYNHLNLPTEVNFTYPLAAMNEVNSGKIKYIYDATGVKLSKEVIQNSVLLNAPPKTTVYAGNYVYEGYTLNNTSLQFFNHPEGYVEPTSNPFRPFQYVYQYKDYLGNIRLSYSDDDGDGHIDVARDTNGNGNYDLDVDGEPQDLSNPDYANEIREESNYYPFGLKHKGYNNVITGRDHKYGFGGKEYNDELGLDWYDVSARNYDPALGRWMNLDPLAEDMRRHSPYNFGFDNPVYFQDYDGMAPSGANDCCGGWNPIAGIGDAIASAVNSTVNKVSKALGLDKMTPVLEASAKTHIGVQAGFKAKVGGIGEVKLKANLASVELASGKADLTDPINPDSYSGENAFNGDGKGLKVEQSLEATGSIVGKEVIGANVKSTFRGNQYGSSEPEITGGVYLIAPIAKKSSKSQSFNGNGLGKTPSSKAKLGKPGNFYGIDVGAGAALILGVDVNLKIGVNVKN